MYTVLAQIAMSHKIHVLCAIFLSKIFVCAIFYVFSSHICVGHTAWVPKECKWQSQAQRTQSRPKGLGPYNSSHWNIQNYMKWHFSGKFIIFISPLQWPALLNPFIIFAYLHLSSCILIYPNTSSYIIPSSLSLFSHVMRNSIAFTNCCTFSLAFIQPPNCFFTYHFLTVICS